MKQKNMKLNYHKISEDIFKFEWKGDYGASGEFYLNFINHGLSGGTAEIQPKSFENARELTEAFGEAMGIDETSTGVDNFEMGVARKLQDLHWEIKAVHDKIDQKGLTNAGLIDAITNKIDRATFGKEVSEEYKNGYLEALDNLRQDVREGRL